MGAKSSLEQKQPYFTCGCFAHLTDGKCNYALEGCGDGELVLFCHGLNAFMGQFEKLSKLLIKAGYRTLRFDLWGHGLSDSPLKLDYSIEMYIRQIQDLLNHLGLLMRPLILIGFSLGGYICAKYAATFAHEGLVTHLVCIAPAGLLVERPFGNCAACLLGPCGCCTMCVTSLCTSRCCVRRKYFDGIYTQPEEYPTEHAAKEEMVYERFRNDASRSLITMFRIARAIPFTNTGDVYRVLADYDIEVFFLWGLEDDVAPLAECWLPLQRFMSHRPFRLFPDCGHQVLVEAWPDIGEDILDWLDTDLVKFRQNEHAYYIGPNSMPVHHVKPIYEKVMTEGNSTIINEHTAALGLYKEGMNVDADNDPPKKIKTQKVLKAKKIERKTEKEILVTTDADDEVNIESKCEDQDTVRKDPEQKTKSTNLESDVKVKKNYTNKKNDDVKLMPGFYPTNPNQNKRSGLPTPSALPEPKKRHAKARDSDASSTVSIRFYP